VENTDGGGATLVVSLPRRDDEPLQAKAEGIDGEVIHI
jgi:two-component system OmpR family sensor kinase